ncbi:hypothetical protein H6F76_02190 [Leptolyngbya sp. FACHB-321]|uniref:hypothetical protein n=1 Tax=Leptolyngbya sp. FACHB-321 TaxID=2692807 RepID=UPI00168825DF|nr:hypothetical protein [Leptolyngbya sp. FACHB-321]MBD2033863.1 hypothetical protein [Leptolyngbya sp. FACHB-321]
MTNARNMSPKEDCRLIEDFIPGLNEFKPRDVKQPLLQIDLLPTQVYPGSSNQH